MLYGLRASPVSRYFTLDEALRWVAYREYPTSWWFIEDFHGIEEIFEQSSKGYPKEPFFPGDDLENIRLKKLGLTYPSDDDDVDYHTGEISAYDAATRADDRLNKYFVESHYIQQCCLDPYINQLFLKLHSGEIAAYGQFMGKLRKDISPKSWKNKLDWEKLNDVWEAIEYGDTGTFSEKDVQEVIAGKLVKGFQKISPEFWNSDGINWAYSYATSPLGFFHLIFIPAEILFSHFPHPEGKAIGVENRAGYLIYDDKGIDADSIQHIESQRGRPRYNWPEFHAEITRYCLEKGQIPNLQKDIEHHMKDWCQERWGVAPGHATLHEQISPLYAEKKKEKKNVKKSA